MNAQGALKSRKTILLSKKDVQELLTMDEVLTAVEEVFLAHGRQEVIMPAKITLDLSGMAIESWTNAMPAYVRPYGAAGIKWAGGYINNPKVGLPYIVATIVLQDPVTGLQLSIMDGTHITNLRTGAVAGVVAKHFASKGPSTVAIIGSGTQGRTSLDALTRTVVVREVRTYDRVSQAARKYATEMSAAKGIPVLAANTAEEAVAGADIVVTATPSNEPIVRFTWLKKGSLSISLGSYQEFDDETSLRSDKVFVDSWAQCAHRGELARLVAEGKFSEKDIAGEIGDVLAGRVPGRTSDSETILTVPIGLGSLDIAIAKRVYDKAVRLGKGLPVEL